MADTRIAALTELTAPDAADEFVVVDKSDTSMAGTGTDKRIKLQTFAPIIIRKTADETVNNSNTLQDDNELLLPVVANATYQFEMQLLLSAANATADWGFHWTVPSGTTMFWGEHARQDASQAMSARWDGATAAQSALVLATEASTPLWGSVAGTGGLFVRGIIRVAATAGNVQLQWAQATANATDSKVLKDSLLIARKIA